MRGVVKAQRLRENRRLPTVEGATGARLACDAGRTTVAARGASPFPPPGASNKPNAPESAL